MEAHISGVMAAPNGSRMKVKILAARQADSFPDKWLLELEIIDSQPVRGGVFATPGETREGFTFRSAWDLPLPAIVEPRLNTSEVRRADCFI
jgi:hypothetical protein